MNTRSLNEIHNAWYAGLDEGHSQKETSVSTKTFTDDEVYKALQGKDSLDALLVWRMAEAAHGITEGMQSMTDKELLELAAKAVGMHVKAQRVDADDKFTHLVVGQKFKPEKIDWNPLTDDGSALRLAVRLNIEFACFDDSQKVNSGVWSAYDYVTPYNGDKQAATRRAIVRVAAEIGRAMP